MLLQRCWGRYLICVRRRHSGSRSQEQYMLTPRWIPRICVTAFLMASSASISEFIPEQSDHTRNLHSVMAGVLGRRPSCNNVCTKCSAHAGCSGDGPDPAWAHSGCTTGWSAEEIRSSYSTGRAGRFFTPAACVRRPQDGLFFMAHAPPCKDDGLCNPITCASLAVVQL